jgi:HEAT repeat protein
VCLTKLNQPGVVEPYLAGLQLDDQDPLVSARQRRLAVAFLAALGDPAIGGICQGLKTASEPVKWVVVRALAASAAPDAAACLAENTQHPDAGVRAAATAGLRLLIARGRMKPQQAWDLVQPLTQDPDAKVRLEAVNAVAMFSWEHASRALAGMEKDSDAQVASVARGTLEGLRNFKNLSPDLPY